MSLSVDLAGVALGRVAFAVRQLFTLGQDIGGAHWFDSPSLYPGGNHLYLYKDSAGTTPVTAVGDTIGLSLDRAYGGARGSELATSTSWTLPTGWSFSNGVLSYDGTGALNSRAYLPVSTPGSKAYWVAFSVLSRVGSGSVGVGTGNADALSTISPGPTNTTTGDKTWFSSVAASGASLYFQVIGSATQTFSISGFSVREIPGTHLIQATGTARPTLSARVNLLLATEDFSSANWQKVNGGTGSAPVVTSNAATAPNGTTTADKIDFSLGAGTTAGDYSIVQQSVSLTGTHKGAIWIKADAPVRIMLRVGATWLAVDATTEWQSFTPLQENSNSIQFGLRAGYGIASLPTAATVYVWGADLRTADDAAKNIPAYQRVGATAADHDTDGFPHYALFDGTDDSWASAATVDGSATDKVTVVAGVTKNSDAALGLVAEMSATIGGNNGAFAVYAPTGAAGANFAALSRGTTLRTATTSAAYAAPSSKVLTLGGDISGDTVAARVNSVADGSETGDQGTGNYGNHTLYVGSRGGLSSRLNGRLYSIVFRFGAMGEADRNRLEQWTKNLMRLT